uniref:Shootin-1 n=1 Tax=Sander lucioperca TaxID=283035 RepID=A0A8D0A484_SANLU
MATLDNLCDFTDVPQRVSEAAPLCTWGKTYLPAVTNGGRSGRRGRCSAGRSICGTVVAVRGSNSVSQNHNSNAVVEHYRYGVFSFVFNSLFFLVSQMVIEEVNAIQEDLVMERTCRESAEALATKLNRQNRSLKRKSMMLLPLLGPEAIAEISLDDEEENESEELHAASMVCLSAQCQTTISELQNKLEKHPAVTDLEAVREQLRETREELLKEKHDNTVLIAETVRQKKLLGKYNRVSQFAVEEYEALQDTLNLERDLRTEAESFARAMVVEQTKLKRQSQILMQSSSPSQALQEALSQVTGLTQELETQRLKHQSQVRAHNHRELTALRRKLELVEEEKREYSNKCSKAEVAVKDLRSTGKDMFGTVSIRHTVGITLSSTGGPGPLGVPQMIFMCASPCSALLSLIRKRTDISTDIPLVVQDSAKTPEVDIRQQAVEEMMHRIKKGVQLRPVSQSPNRTRRQVPSIIFLNDVTISVTSNVTVRLIQPSINPSIHPSRHPCIHSSIHPSIIHP